MKLREFVMKKNINTMNSDDTKCVKMLCSENPNIVLKTEFGIGHYRFVDFKELKGDLVLEFKLLEDSHYRDTENINKHIGKLCLLTIGQFLYVHSDLAYA